MAEAPQSPTSGESRGQSPALPPTHPLGADEPAVQTYRRYEAAFEGVRAPFAFIDLDAVWANATAILSRAAGKPIRVATAAVRCRAMLARALELDHGFQGLLTFTMAETNWLWEQGFRDLVCAYPSTDRAELHRLARITGRDPEEAPVAIVDCVEHLDLIEDAATGTVAPIRVAIDVDLGYDALGGLVSLGHKRSPIRTAAQAGRLAGEIERRKGVKLAGLLAYEGQIAGVGDDVPGRAVKNAAVRAMQRSSLRDVRTRRARIVTELLEISELRFVNGGGTGSIELTAAEGAVTEVAVGSGLYAPVGADHHRSLALAPAAIFALPVVRRPGRGAVTVLGGGYPASGPGSRDRLPVPYLPAGLKLDLLEGAGEVQTPLLGEAANLLEIGDRVYLRPVKAGELCERFDSLYLIAGGMIRDQVPTYRGDGKTFL